MPARRVPTFWRNESSVILPLYGRRAGFGVCRGIVPESSDCLTDAQRARKRQRKGVDDACGTRLRVSRETKGDYALVAIDHVEAAFRARMQALAHKGGAVTKRRYGNNPRYYRDIGRLGGNAPVAARKARLAAEVDGVATNESPILDAAAASAEAPQAPPRPTLSPYKKLLHDLRKASPYRPSASRSDDFAEQQVARIMAQMNHRENGELG